MFLRENIEGKFIDLKSVDFEDADFTLQIRKDPAFVKYLPKINNSIENQKAWIKKQRASDDDYFWVVLDKKGNRIGTIGVFDIKADPPKAGRLALKGNALQNIEANYLAYKFGLDILKLDQLWGFIYSENKRAIRFAKLFGGQIGLEYLQDGRLIRNVVFSQPYFGEAEKSVRRMLYKEA